MITTASLSPDPNGITSATFDRHFHFQDTGSAGGTAPYSFDFFAQQFEDTTLPDDVKTMLDVGVPINRIVATASGKRFLRHIAPYKDGTSGATIGGIVVYVSVDGDEPGLDGEATAQRKLIAALRGCVLLLLDTEGRVIMCSPSVQEELGFSVTEALRQPMDFLWPQEQRSTVSFKDTLATAATHGCLSFCGWRVRKNGSRFWARGMLSAIREDGVITGYAKVLFDDTEQKQTLDDQKELLDRTLQEKTLMEDHLTTVAHELRTPLNAVALWTKLLTESSPLNAGQVTEGLGVIGHCTHHQQYLIEQLLDHAQLKSERLKLNLQPTDIGVVAAAALDALRPLAKTKGINIVRDLMPGLRSIPCDIHRLNQIFWNLLSNALKFTSAGGQITCTVHDTGNEILITVTDTGDGIKADYLQHIFEPFTCHNAAKSRESGGLGLGLSITQKLVELHGGRITASSSGPGKGTTFRVTLPANSMGVSTPLT